MASTFARSEETFFQNIPKRYLDSRTKSLAISTIRSTLVLSLRTYNMKWFGRTSVIVVLRYVLTRRRALNDRSLVAFVAGMTIINLANLMTYENSCCWCEECKYASTLESVTFSTCGILWVKVLRCASSSR